MNNNETDIFKDIIGCLKKNALGHALRLTRTFVDAHPYLMYDDGLEDIERDYKFMLDYFKQGFDDPQREDLYGKLIRRLYKFIGNLLLSYRIKNVSFYSEASRKSINRSFSNDRIKAELESFVTDTALLTLEPEEKRLTKSKEIHLRHNEFMQALFCHIVTSRQWSDTEATFFEDLLLSPTTDSMDAQMTVSALTVATMNIMDVLKFNTLVNVYLKATDETVRQKALVGWVFALSSDMKTDPQLQKIVSAALEKPGVANELSDLQKQILFCMNTEKDNDRIQKDIMPELIKNNNINITRFGITEKEEDPMTDVFDPDAADRAMEKMEESFRKMMNMQKAGSDIYFGGFSQMKRFAFFFNTANWFCPFYLEHPEISSVTDSLKDTPLLTAILKNGPFCDSDKYSFTLALSSVISRLPANMREMMNTPEALGHTVSDEDQKEPAYIRRMILQDMYRFFRLFPQREQLINPFDKEHYIFVTDNVFHDTDMQKYMSELCYFMIKHKNGEALGRLLESYHDENDAKYLLFHGIYELDFNDNPYSACGYLEMLNELDGTNRRGLKLLARAYFATEDYDNAAECYGRLLDEDTDNKNIALNYCVSLTKARRYDEALNLLYKLSLEEPDSIHVTRVLAWTLMGLGRIDQAEKEYGRILGNKDAESGDKLNAGYCMWIKGNTPQAIELFNDFISMNGGNKHFQGISKEFIKDYDFLKDHGITDLDIRLMTEILNA